MTSRIAKIWIDTDGGVDDALALACACRDTRIEVAGISTVFGNVAPRRAARNAALIQHLAGRVPCRVHVGAEQPLLGSWRHARAIHGEDGIGGASTMHTLPYENDVIRTGGVAGAMARFARDAGPGGALVCIGPLTNLASALAADAEAFSRIGRIVVMGGALSVPRVRRGGAEFNFGSDLVAVRGVFARAPRLTIMPLDVCRQVILRRGRLQAIAAAAPGRLTAFLRRAHQHYMDAYRALEGIDGCYPHDALAVAVLAASGIVTLEQRQLELDDAGGFPGLLRAGPAARPIDIAVSVDQRRALDWIESCLRGNASA